VARAALAARAGDAAVAGVGPGPGLRCRVWLASELGRCG
jgi:hypothetical protein